MLREVKPKTARSARALASKGPLQNENPKKALFLKSTSSSSLLNSLTSNLYSLKKPFALRFSKKNALHPFEDTSSLEFFSQKNDTSLLVFASHSKKRPHCLTFVRCYDGKVLDMLEGLVDAETARTFEQFSSKNRVALGMKPLLSFSGPGFAAQEAGGGGGDKFATAKSLFLDLFRGEEASDVDAEGLQMMISFTAAEVETTVEGGEPKQMVYMRVWRIVTRKSGQKLPRVELEEMGPRIDFRLGRVQVADTSVLREALKKARGSEAKVKKNIDTDIMGDKMGRIHLGKQDLSELQTRKMKGLKRGRDELDDGDVLPDADEGEISGEDDLEDDNDEDLEDLEDMHDLIDDLEDGKGNGVEEEEAEEEDLLASADKPKRQKIR